MNKLFYIMVLCVAGFSGVAVGKAVKPPESFPIRCRTIGEIHESK